MRLIAKATDSSIQDRLKRGADGIEIQMIKTDFKLTDYSLPIENVHTRLFDNTDVCIDQALNCYLGCQPETDYNIYKFLTDAMEMAEEAAIKQDMTVNVVCHLYYPKSLHPDHVWVSFLRELFDKYPDVNILVENSSIADGSKRFRNMSSPSTVPDWLNYIKGILPKKYKDRIQGVFDICHAFMCIREMNLIYKAAGIQEFITDEQDELEKYFKSFSEVCRTVHFNYIKGLGIGRGCHGVPASGEDLEHLYELFMEYTPDAKIVLEVYEEDVSKAVNFETMGNELRNIDASYKKIKSFDHICFEEKKAAV